MTITARATGLARAAAGVGTWDWDLRNGVLQWSPEIFRILGVDPGCTDLVQAWADRLHPQDREAAMAAAAGLRDRAGEFALEFRIVHPTAGVRWILSKGASVADDTGRVVRALGINIDLTERQVPTRRCARASSGCGATYEQAPVGIAESDEKRAGFRA